MAYSYQTFSSGQVYTSGQAQQVEDNIRDHRHGKDGVGVAGAAWEVTSKGAAFSITSADAGKMFACYGDFQIDFAAAATLGGNFACAVKNVGSGRIVQAAASGGYIEGSSLFVVTPGEAYITQSDASKLLNVGNVHGPVRLCRAELVGSLLNIDLKHLYPGDFDFYEFIGHFYQQSVGIITAQVSINSGSSYENSGYTTSTGDTTLFRLFATTTNSFGGVLSKFEFQNAVPGAGLSAFVQAWRRTSASAMSADEMQAYTSSLALINALRISATAGSFSSGTVVEIYGRGRRRDVI